MKQMNSLVRISVIDAAVNQLDWAIRLFLDHHAFVPAITLAGAAEELVGKALSNEHRAHSCIRKNLESKGYDEGDVKKLMNFARNALKHGPEKRSGPVFAGGADPDVLELYVETEAIQVITRAIINLAAFDQSVTSETPRFLKWVHGNRKDLIE